MFHISRITLAETHNAEIAVWVGTGGPSPSKNQS